MAIKNSWASGEVLTAADLTDTMKGVYINPQTGTSYTFALTDGFVTLSNASGGTATIPTNATAAFNIGAVIGVMNAGTAGSFVIAPAATVTLNAVSGTTTLAPLESATIVKLGTNTWQLSKGGGAPDSTQGLYLITTQSFSAAASVNVNNCFSATYENYRLLVTYTPAASLDLNMRLRAAGSDITAANYQQQTLTGADSVAGANRSINQTSIGIAGGDTDENFLIVDIFRPQIAAVTQYAMNNGYKVNTTVPQIVTKNGAYNASTQADGFSLLPSTSSITGTLRVYGYKN